MEKSFTVVLLGLDDSTAKRLHLVSTGLCEQQSAMVSLLDVKI